MNFSIVHAKVFEAQLQLTTLLDNRQRHHTAKLISNCYNNLTEYTSKIIKIEFKTLQSVFTRNRDHQRCLIQIDTPDNPDCR